uniref:EF-hand domain-containing protein n=1 Tax=Guillardia theta TaxID=55529 RepID=A0A7S4NJB6_GUITH|mmetsp:Transcript_23655/g.77006  ORF Transcript_23655/g.77006 Transcript_23655/m.77006 type:complete len:103 (+) Transcript_23655:559-867(+)
MTLFQALHCNLSMNELQEHLLILDPQSSGVIKIPELMPFIAKRLQTRETTDQLIDAFRVFDKENRGGRRVVVGEECGEIICVRIDIRRRVAARSHSLRGADG